MVTYTVFSLWEITCLCTKKRRQSGNTIMATIWKSLFQNQHFENFYFEKIHFEKIQFWIQENPIKKKTRFKKKMVRAWSKKYPLLMASIFFLEHPFWNNPILNTGKSNYKKKRLLKKNGQSFIQKNPLLMASIQFWKNPFTAKVPLGPVKTQKSI